MMGKAKETDSVSFLYVGEGQSHNCASLID